MSIEIPKDMTRLEGVDSEPLSMIGKTLGKYTLVELIGAGGMGHVYRAKHQLLGRSAAIKLLRPSLSRNPILVERFFREAVMTSHITHSGIVEVYDYGTDEDPDGGKSAYLVMELLNGESLHERLFHEGPMSLDEAVDITKQIVSALDAAHRLNVVHRDLKPSNIFLIPDELLPRGERVKVLDFGIAKAFAQGPEVADLTISGAVLGTPSYMSPEQLRGDEVESVSDLYSVGCLLYRMLTGRPPFECETHGEFILAHAFETPPALSEFCEIPAVLNRLVAGLLAADPRERPSHQRVREVLNRLERCDEKQSAIEVGTIVGVPSDAPPTPEAPVNKERVTELLNLDETSLATVVAANPFGEDHPTSLAADRSEKPPVRAQQASFQHAMGPLLTPLHTLLEPAHESGEALMRPALRRPTTVRPRLWWQLEPRRLLTIAGTALIALTIGLLALASGPSETDDQPTKTTDAHERSSSSAEPTSQPTLVATVTPSVDAANVPTLSTELETVPVRAPDDLGPGLATSDPSVETTDVPLTETVDQVTPPAQVKERRRSGSRDRSQASRPFVSIRSKPAGADVRSSPEGPSLGRTPILLERNAEAPQTVWVDLDGFEPSRVVLDKDVLRPVVLERRSRPAKAPFDRM